MMADGLRMASYEEVYEAPVPDSASSTVPADAVRDISEPKESIVKGQSQATELVEIAGEKFRFGVATTGEPFGVAGDRPGLAQFLRGGRQSLRASLALAYSEKRGRAPSSSALADALLVIEGRALRETPEQVALRVAESRGGIVLDLGRPDMSVLRIDTDGWKITESDVLFRRTELTAQLPVPVRGGSLDDFAQLLNVQASDIPLLVAWEIATMFPNLPHPILALVGEQGTGKSTAQRFLANLVDPSPAPGRSMPRNVDSWLFTAAGSHVVPVDNVSGIPDWFSDALCRASTGDAIVRRRLYTDSDLSVITLNRCVILSSIDPGAMRGDLGDRLLPIELEPISRKARRPETALDEQWRTAHASALGGLLDLMVEVLRVLPSVRLESLPRMADFARIVEACDVVLGTNGMTAYMAVGERIASDVVQADPVAIAVLQMLKARDGAWTGTATELLEELFPEQDAREEGMGVPRTGRGMSGALRRAAPALRAQGVQVDFDRSERREVRISRVGNGRDRRERSDDVDGSSQPTSSGVSRSCDGKAGTGSAGEALTTR